MTSFIQNSLVLLGDYSNIIGKTPGQFFISIGNDGVHDKVQAHETLLGH